MVAKLFQLTLLCLVAASASCSPSPERHTKGTLNTQYSEFWPDVDAYVRQKWGWPRDEYWIEFNRRQGARLVYDVINVEDETRPPSITGGGKSFEVWIDPTIRRVVGEYHFE